MFKYCSIILIFASFNLFAQKEDKISEHRPKYVSDYKVNLYEKMEPNSVKFYETINSSLNIYLDSVKTIYSNRKVAKKAFVVLAYNGNEREDALKMRSKILKYFPDENLKLDYSAPSWKLKIGPYLKKLDAVRVKEGLKKKGMTNVLIVPDLIQYGGR